jgi:hypothetical protein
MAVKMFVSSKSSMLADGGDEIAQECEGDRAK